MSPARPLLLASLLINVGLAIGWTVSRSVSAGAADAGVPSEAVADVAAAPDEPLPPWTSLESLDDAGFARELRAQGWAPPIVRALVAARLEAGLDSERARILREHRIPYWRGRSFGDFGGGLTAAGYAAIRRLEDDKRRRLAAALGEDAIAPAAIESLRRRFGPFAPEKLEQLAAIDTDYRDLVRQTQEETMGLVLPEDRQLLALLEQEKRDDLAALLTPEEMETYELRASDLAFQLRFRLRDFDASEEEYVAIFRIQQAMEELYGGRHATPEQRRQRQAAQPRYEQQLATLLGEERYRDYEIKTHGTWNQTKRWVDEQRLPESSATSLTALTVDIERQLRALGQDRTLSGAEREARRAALARESERRLAGLLTPEQVQAFRSGPGRLLRSLEARRR